jgi:hypothetical protein
MTIGADPGDLVQPLQTLAIPQRGFAPYQDTDIIGVPRNNGFSRLSIIEVAWPSPCPEMTKASLLNIIPKLQYIIVKDFLEEYYQWCCVLKVAISIIPLSVVLYSK